MTVRSGATRGQGRASTVAPPRWVLLALGNGVLTTYPLAPGGELILGRDLDCDIVLEHHRVSRRHAQLHVGASDDELSIEDLGSRSGTRVGEPLKRNQPAPVRLGDAIGIGPFVLTVVRGPARAPASLVIEAPVPSALPPALLGIARGAGHVLVRGEAGAPARVLAEALHHLSGRGGRFVSLDCAATAAAELEGELVGREDGGPRPGVLEAAGEGTVFLEEVRALPPPLQLRLLQAIEERRATRAGGAAPFEVAARLVCTAHGNLLEDVEAGVFRLDLYYRLAGTVVTIRAPGVGLGPEEEAERRRVLDALDHCGGNQTRAAKLLGISRGALVSKLSSYRIPRATRARK